MIVFICHQRICKIILKLQLFYQWMGLLWVTKMLHWYIVYGGLYCTFGDLY